MTTWCPRRTPNKVTIMANWNWFWKRKKKQPPRRSKPRRLVLEHLEPRQLLSGNPFAATLAKVTPDPQPSGDQPSAEAATVSLAAYTPAAINDPGVAPSKPYLRRPAADL